MAQSIKLKDENYIDSSGVTHNRELLFDILNNQNDILNYSTTEKSIGKYYDGKTIYRKTIRSTYSDQNSKFVLLSNISTLIKGYGYCKGSGGTKQLVPMANAFLSLTSDNQVILNAENMHSVEYEVTLEYTKI